MPKLIEKELRSIRAALDAMYVINDRSQPEELVKQLSSDWFSRISTLLKQLGRQNQILELKSFIDCIPEIPPTDQINTNLNRQQIDLKLEWYKEFHRILDKTVVLVDRNITLPVNSKTKIQIGLEEAYENVKNREEAEHYKLGEFKNQKKIADKKNEQINFLTGTDGKVTEPTHRVEVMKSTFISGSVADVNTLVVILHGWGKDGEYDKLTAIKDSVIDVLPEADILLPRYNSSRKSNDDPYQLADCIENLIGNTFDRSEKKYSRIILISHSLGGLLLRKAYLYGQGFVQDRKSSKGSRRAPKPWIQCVERIILFSGANRGWSLESKPTDMGQFEFETEKLSLSVARFFDQGRFIRNLEKGSPFVANTRIQWVQLTESGKASPVIQLLPASENKISFEDNKDSAVSNNFIFIDVPSTDHASILEVDSRGYVEDIFKSALTQEISVLRKENELTFVSPESDTKREITDIVFVMHGIRDYGGWTTNFKKMIENRSSLHKVVTPSYNYFPALHFLLFWKRQKNVRWFVDQFTQLYAQYPQAKFSFIGHSNGTYIVANALQNYHALSLHRISLAGSVVRRDFPWDELVKEGRIFELRNDMAACDWPVGLFTKYFESWSWLIEQLTGRKLAKISDLGAGGFNGFTSIAGQEYVMKYFPGDHGAAITSKENIESISKFITDGYRDQRELSQINQFLSFLSNLVLMWLSTVIILLIWLVDSNPVPGVVHYAVDVGVLLVVLLLLDFI